MHQFRERFQGLPAILEKGPPKEEEKEDEKEGENEELIPKWVNGVVDEMMVSKGKEVELEGGEGVPTKVERRKSRRENIERERFSNAKEFRLPQNIPKSEIVDNSTEIKGAIRRLSSKYLSLGSEFEVNISHKRREKWSKAMEDLETSNWLELTHFFDEIIEDLLGLMNDSFSRFVESDGFAEIYSPASLVKTGGEPTGASDGREGGGETGDRSV